MRNNEWSLVFFTLISQLSVGILLIFCFLNFAYPNVEESNGIWLKSPEILILILLGIAAIISLLHLGKPMNATNSMNNYIGSWISKEIISLGLLLAMVFVLFLMKWVFISPIWLLNSMMIISSIAGIVFIYSMSRIYMIETIPTWNTLFTPFSFFMSVTLFSLLSIFSIKSVGTNLVPYELIVLVFIVFLVLLLAINVLHQFNLLRLENLGIDNLFFNKGIYLSLFIGRVLLIVLAIGCLLIIYANIEKTQLNQLLEYILISGLLVQEIIGRILFYQSYIRLGV